MIITYDIDWLEDPPQKGEYLVSIGKKGIGSVWRILAIRQVKQKVVRDHARYSISVQSMPDLKALTDWDGDRECPSVWVKGEQAYPLVWYPREKKK